MWWVTLACVMLPVTTWGCASVSRANFRWADPDAAAFTSWDCEREFPEVWVNAETLKSPHLFPILEHERDHARVWQRTGCQGFKERYTSDTAMRLATEASAFCRQSLAAVSLNLFGTLDDAVRHYASSLQLFYGLPISYEQAVTEIKHRGCA